MLRQTMTEQESFLEAKKNYRHLAKICERLELDGYWEQAQKVLKQSVITSLNLYVQSVLLLYAVYAHCLTPQIQDWLQTITEEDTLRIAELGTHQEILHRAKKITYSPPVLLQLCGVADRENHTETACVFLDSMLNLILVVACYAQSPVQDVTKFLQEYYQHVHVFLNQDTAKQKMNTRYLFRKLSCERLEDSLCIYLEDKQREDRQKKMKEDLKRLELSENHRRKTYIATEEEQQEKQEGHFSTLELELPEAEEQKDITPAPVCRMFVKTAQRLSTLNLNGLYENPRAGNTADIVTLNQEKRTVDTDMEEKRELLPDQEAIKEGFHSLKVRMESARHQELDSLLEELHSLIGLGAVKEEIDSLINLIKVRKMREQYQMPMMDMTYHMVFTGSPGTGKTTVARLVAKIYKELGILSKGEVVETDRSGLVAGYIGQTAIKVKDVVDSALGGVLFIDEAYALTNGSRTEDFGSEVIDTLVKLMEDHRDDLVVIVAGYTKEMKEFLKSNSGLVSRFNKFIEFPDYTDTELLDILDNMAEKAGFLLEPAAREQIGGQLLCMTKQKRQDFGNARGIRNVFEKIVVNQANRLVGTAVPTKQDLARLTEDDAAHVIL